MTEYFEGAGWRTSSRFADRVVMKIDDSTATVTGPRISRSLYRVWIASMKILLAAVPPLLIVAIVLWDWIYLVIAVALFSIQFFILANLGASVLWSFVNFMSATSGKYPSVSFPLSSVKRVTLGRGWDRRGLFWAIPYLVPMINKGSEGHCVTFEAPDGETGKDVVYTLSVPEEKDAAHLVELLTRA